MKETKRQKQVSAVLEQELNLIFQRLGLSTIQGALVSIASVKITPDLAEARVYLSYYNVKDVKAALKTVEDRSWEIKRELATAVRHQLRIVPTLVFYIDDTLDYVDKMEHLFKEIKAQDSSSSPKP